jgi:hypothetical protein
MKSIYFLIIAIALNFALEWQVETPQIKSQQKNTTNSIEYSHRLPTNNSIGIR